MINAVNPVASTPKAVKTVNKSVQVPAELLKKGGKNGGAYASIDEKQNDNLVMELNYIGTQLKAILDLKAGKNVKVSKYSNELPEDSFKTNAQKQKDEAIVELGYIGDVLKKIADVNAGKEVESVKTKKQADRI